MLLYAVRRIAVLAPTVIIVMLITFTLGYYGPIDPVRAVLGEEWEDETRYAEVKKALGLDRPFMIQFLAIWGPCFQLGASLARSAALPVTGRSAKVAALVTPARARVYGRWFSAV